MSGTAGTAGTPETVADLVAVTREIADKIEKDTDWENDILTVDHSIVDAFRNLASRYEAANARASELLKANIARVRELEGLLGGAADAMLGCAIEKKKKREGVDACDKLRDLVWKMAPYVAVARDKAEAVAKSYTGDFENAAGAVYARKCVGAAESLLADARKAIGEEEWNRRVEEAGGVRWRGV